MCQTYTFYYVCGHVHSTNTVQCPFAINNILAKPHHVNLSSSNGNPSPRRLCTDISNETKYIPNLCTMCSTHCQIGEWFERNPAARFEAVRAWKSRLREDVQSQGQSDSGLDYGQKLPSGTDFGDGGSGRRVSTGPSLIFGDSDSDYEDQYDKGSSESEDGYGSSENEDDYSGGDDEYDRGSSEDEGEYSGGEDDDEDEDEDEDEELLPPIAQLWRMRIA